MQLYCLLPPARSPIGPIQARMNNDQVLSANKYLPPSLVLLGPQPYNNKKTTKGYQSEKFVMLRWYWLMMFALHLIDIGFVFVGLEAREVSLDTLPLERLARRQSPDHKVRFVKVCVDDSTVALMF